MTVPILYTPEEVAKNLKATAAQRLRMAAEGQIAGPAGRGHVAHSRTGDLAFLESRAAAKPAIGPKHPDYQEWLEYFSIKALGPTTFRLSSQFPSGWACKTTWVRAALVDWRVVCSDAEMAARLLQLRPDSPSYLPPATQEWANAAEQVLSARVVSIEARQTDGPDPGVCFSPPLPTEGEKVQQGSKPGRAARRTRSQRKSGKTK